MEYGLDRATIHRGAIAEKIGCTTKTKGQKKKKKNFAACFKMDTKFHEATIKKIKNLKWRHL